MPVPKRIAALDLGTNSFHLVVAEVSESASLRTVTREKEMLRLGDEVAAHGRIGPEAFSRAVSAVARLAEVARAQGAGDVVAAATAAIREAENGADLVDAITAECGVEVEVISGEREAQLIFRAIQASLDFGGEHVLGCDIGGGSVEFMVGGQRTLDWVASVRLGVGRLTAQFVRDDPLPEGARQALETHVRRTLAPVAEEARLYGFASMVGTSGTLLTLARLAAAGRVDDAHLDGFRVGAATLAALCDDLARSDAARRARLDIEARRAGLMPAAAVLVKAILETFAIGEVAFGTWGLREGLLLRQVEHPVLALATPRKTRARSVLALGRRHGFDELHGRQTARLASSLFDQLGAGLGLDEQWREPLELAALVHDVGNSIARKGHHRHGAYLLHYGELAGFEPDDRALLVALVRYHRSGTPRPGQPEFDALAPPARDALLPLLALLRVADGLDSSRHANVLGIEARLDDGAVVLRLTSTTGDPGLDLWGARRKVALLAAVTGRRVTVLGPAEPIPTIA